MSSCWQSFRHQFSGPIFGTLYYAVPNYSAMQNTASGELPSCCVYCTPGFADYQLCNVCMLTRGGQQTRRRCVLSCKWRVFMAYPRQLQELFDDLKTHSKVGKIAEKCWTINWDFPQRDRSRLTVTLLRNTAARHWGISPGSIVRQVEHYTGFDARTETLGPEWRNCHTCVYSATHCLQGY